MWRSAFVALLISADAVACSCAARKILFPANNAVLPTNPTFVFGAGAFGTFELIEADGGILQTFSPTGIISEYRPTALLAPNTGYRLTENGAPSVEFRTGGAADTEAPVLPSFSTELSVLPGPCAAGETLVFRPIDPHDDQTLPVELRYAFLDDDFAPTLLIPHDLTLEGRSCQTTGYPLTARKTIRGALVAIDFAGNRSRPTLVQTIKSPGGCSAAPAGPLLLALLVTLRRVASTRAASTARGTG